VGTDEKNLLAAGSAQFVSWCPADLRLSGGLSRSGEPMWTGLLPDFGWEQGIGIRATGWVFSRDSCSHCVNSCSEHFYARPGLRGENIIQWGRVQGDHLYREMGDAPNAIGATIHRLASIRPRCLVLLGAWQ